MAMVDGCGTFCPDPAFYKMKSVSKAAVLFNNPLFSDITINFSDRSIKAHRSHLFIESKYFEKLFTIDMADSNVPVLELHDDFADGVYAMFEYIYKHDYSTPEQYKSMTDLLLFHTRVYITANKYDLPALRTLAVDKFFRNVNFEGHVHRVREEDAWDAYAKAAKLIYDNCVASNDALRICFVDISDGHKAFLALHGVKSRELMTQIPDLALDIAMHDINRAATRAAGAPLAPDLSYEFVPFDYNCQMA